MDMDRTPAPASLHNITCRNNSNDLSTTLEEPVSGTSEVPVPQPMMAFGSPSVCHHPAPLDSQGSSSGGGGTETQLSKTPKKKKKKKPKKNSYKELMSGMLQSDKTEEEDRADNQRRLQQHLGGGTFSKLDRI